MEHFCIKKPYDKREAEVELEMLSQLYPNFPWEVRFCQVCEQYHVWRDFMAEYGRLSYDGQQV